MDKELYCPECHSTSLDKYGSSISGRHYYQRYLCRKCLRTTVRPHVKRDLHTSGVTIEHNQSVIQYDETMVLSKRNE